MKKTMILAAVSMLALASAAQARDLTVVSWGGAYQDAQKEIYFKPFEAASGKKLIDESWDGGVGVLRAKVESGHADWDVVQVESDELAMGCDEGLYEKLDYSRIGGKDSYIPEAVSPCGVAAIVYNFAIAYDGDKLKNGPTGWADFFDTKKFPGKRGMRQGPKANLEMALLADGVPTADVYKVLATPAGVERALAKLDTIKKDLIFWKAGAQPPQLLASGEVVMTWAYNGRITAANAKDNKHFKIVWPGSLYTMDSWVILKGSPNKDSALDLLKFMGAAENQKKLPAFISYGVTNKAATALIDPKLLPDLPTAEQNRKGTLEISAAFWLDNADRLTERFNKWAAQ